MIVVQYMPQINTYLNTTKRHWGHLTTSQKISFIIIILLLALSPLLIFAVYQQIELRSRANPITPITPITPPSPSPVLNAWGNAVKFTNYTGINGYLTVDRKSNIQFGNSFTIEFWLKPNTSYASQQVLISKARELISPYRKSSYYIQLQNNGLSFWLNESPVAWGAAPVTIGGWNFVAMSYENGNLYTIVNGNGTTKNNVSFQDTDLPININGLLNIEQYGSTVDYINRDTEIDEIRISKIARYKSSTGGSFIIPIPDKPFTDDADTLALYHLNENTGDAKLKDSSSNTNDGSIKLKPEFLSSTLPQPPEPSPTYTPIPTPSSTNTPTPSPTSKPTPIPLPTSTPTPLPSPTPTAIPTLLPSTTPLPTLISCNPADIDKDGIVDIRDYDLLVNDFLVSNPSHPRSDINKDGIVDITDYSLLVKNYLIETGPCQ